MMAPIVKDAADLLSALIVPVTAKKLGAWLAIITMGLGLLQPEAAGSTVLELSGNEWLRLSEPTQDFYVIGVYDGFFAGSLRAFAALHELQQPESARTVLDRLGQLVRCAEEPGVTRGQMVAIVRQ